MIEKSLLKFDEWSSSFGWRINLKAEFDYRKVCPVDKALRGFSKYEGMPEMKNKDQLLLLNVAALFEKRYVFKSDGILIYKQSNDRILRNFDKADIIIHIKKDLDCVDFVFWNGWSSEFIESNLAKMAKNYNAGFQRSLPLRIVK